MTGALITVSQSALRHNVAALRARLDSGTRFGAVLKGNAYGHGLTLVATAIDDIVDFVVCFDTSDALVLSSLCTATVLLLQPIYGDDLRRCAAAGIHVTVSSFDAVGDLPSGARVHVLVDTGLHRFGVSPSAALRLCHSCRAAGADVVGLYTQVAEDDAGAWRRVEEEVRLLRSIPVDVEYLHVGGSTIALERPDLAGTMVRCGIALYGHPVVPRQYDLTRDLRPSLRLLAPVLEVRSVPAGSGLGYGAEYVSDAPLVVATLGVGVSHGVDPASTSGGFVRLGGKDCRLIGHASMDAALVDVSPVPEIARGDIATVIGGVPSESTSLEGWADRCGVLKDYVLCRLSRHLPRVLIE